MLVSEGGGSRGVHLMGGRREFSSGEEGNFEGELETKRTRELNA